MSQSPSDQAPASLSTGARCLVLALAFLGWMFAGVEMSTFPLATGSLIQDFHDQGVLAPDASATVLRNLKGQWFTYYISAFLLGAALGGLAFGNLGDRVGRASAMGWSIVCYSVVTGVCYFATSPEQLLVLRFLACMGIGGMWPNGVALVSEAWSGVSRPMLAGLIGASANVGITLFGLSARVVAITPENWRWIMLVGAAPVVLGAFVLAFAPESPRWLAAREQSAKQKAPLSVVFSPPTLYRTLVGICLGAIPLLGSWGANKWMLLWADEVGASFDATLKADTQLVWGIGASIGSLMGGWLANRLGRRLSYFLISLGSLAIASYIFRMTDPSRALDFMGPIFVMGLIATSFFGWLPLYLPELFSTSVRATGTGVSYNFGRIISAGVIISTGWLVVQYKGQYERVGATTSLIYLAGMIIVFFMPSKTDESLES